MAEAECDLLFLVDRLFGREEILSLKGLIHGLERRGHRVRVLCASTESDHGLADLTVCVGLGRRWQRAWAVRGLDLSANSQRSRVLHVLNAEMAEAGLEIAERWRLPYLLTVDEFPRREVRLRLSRSWCRGLIATNPELAIALARDFQVPPAVIHQVPRGIPEPDAPARVARSGRVPVIGASGPLVPGSGFTTFLNAARKVIDAGVDAEFLIAGQGEDEGDLRRRAERLRIADRLTFADEIPTGLTFWDVLDVYCQTSVTPTVGRPLTLAMASGVPAIVADVEGVRTLIQDGESGLIIPHGDSSALAASIIELLADRDRASRFGEAGRQAALLNHHPDRETERLHQLYREITRLGVNDLQQPGSAVGFDGFQTPIGLDTTEPIGPPRLAVAPWSRPEG